MATQFYIDTTGFRFAACDAGLRYDYQNGERTDKVAGTFVEVAISNRAYEKLRISLPQLTPLLADGEVFPEGTFIEFDGLRVRPYVNRSGRLAYTASADAARVVAPKRPGMPEQK
ncbi:MAG: hypothetical protein MR611_00415 [Coriobacteriaceae bacterium]|nr:hypothetical protein [Coriobacteriaceae bacterium]